MSASDEATGALNGLLATGVLDDLVASGLDALHVQLLVTLSRLQPGPLGTQLEAASSRLLGPENPAGIPAERISH